VAQYLQQAIEIARQQRDEIQGKIDRLDEEIDRQPVTTSRSGRARMVSRNA
jgi:hypothetical protein